ncbi:MULTISPECIES: hypothetical protein [Sphingobacterium]|jgi:hypothetical protein|uniref:Uncharacterized protein n=1 Tax=Sphingobacterium multivorum TaxID=28454 RepID=A0A2X2J6M5_SPHMU|nr:MULTISPECIES: hypothetical protein [Sphingobacterium]HAE69288.1 hypothetical protein [Sphingobacterium sp.]KKO91308.1 hypothetical protein AAW12_11010 [Sphingobacterium sp. Ag1]MDF2852644.1 hypothetical protein [Sphingobacterium multivorum]OFV09148.1 hypothetical protein HMPREF3127_24110 [Sphingobacterium sp. HMSC13C05]QQT42983.1 hypothetical protein I6J00_14520 [Sphingobacterium multivorum]
MHEIEPYYNWRDYYIAAEDEQSPFYGTIYSEFDFDKQIYNFLLHPQWDEFGSLTLYLKILFVDYEKQYCIIELIGEWNDAIYNDIMLLKREIIDVLISQGIKYFILIGENVLNFHASDDSYYEEWFQDIDDGWIAGVGFREHVIEEFQQQNIDYYINFGGALNELPWRALKPKQVFHHVNDSLTKRLGF